MTTNYQLPHMSSSEQLYHNVDGVARGIDDKYHEDPSPGSL